MTERRPRDLLEDSLRQSAVLIDRMLTDETMLDSAERLASKTAEAFRQERKLLLFGNGGSAADSVHIAAEFVGRFLTDRRPLPAISLAANLSSVTAISNDYGYGEVFARQVEALGAEGDLAIGLSTSGESENVVAGLEAARKAGLTAVAMTGASPRSAGAAADFTIAIPDTLTPNIQQGHMLIAHIVCHWIEDELIAGRI